MVLVSLRTFSADTWCLNLCYLNVPQQSLKKKRHQPACSSCFILQGSAASLEFSSTCSLTNIFFSVQLQHLQIFLLVSKLVVSDVTFEPIRRSLCREKGACLMKPRIVACFDIQSHLLP